MLMMRAEDPPEGSNVPSDTRTDSEPVMDVSKPLSEDTTLQLINNQRQPQDQESGFDLSRQTDGELSAELKKLSVIAASSATSEPTSDKDKKSDGLAEPVKPNGSAEETSDSAQVQENGTGTPIKLLARNEDRPITPSDGPSPTITVSIQGNQPYAQQLRIDPLDRPDPRLLDALENPRDRIFVIKIEQQLISFVKDKTEEVFEAAASNSYHRLLAHKMAEYYRLTHIADASGTFVRICRGEAARIPPIALSEWPVSIQQQQKAVANGTMPTVKIMRRTTPSEKGAETPPKGSSTPGKAPSETSSEHEATIQAKTSREEREAQYQEARARIFKDFVESPPETPPPGKPEKKRPEKPDDFSGRNQFYPVMTMPTIQPQQYYSQPPYQDGTYAAQPPMPQMPARGFNPMMPPFTPGSQGYAPNHHGYAPTAQGFPSAYGPSPNRSFVSFNGNGAAYPQSQLPPQPLYPPQHPPQQQQQQQQQRGLYSTPNGAPPPAQFASARPPTMQPSYSSNGFPPLPQSNPQPQFNRFPMPSQNFSNPMGSGIWGNGRAVTATTMGPRSSSAPMENAWSAGAPPGAQAWSNPRGMRM